MLETKRNRFWHIYGWILSALVVIACLSLMVGCISIYVSHEGKNGMFNRDIIRQTFSYIAIPVWASLACVIVGGLISCVYPKDEKSLSSKPVPATAFWLLFDKRGGTSLSASLEKKLRLVLLTNTLPWCLVLSLGIPPLVYAADSSHFAGSDYDLAVVTWLLYWVLPYVVLVGVCFYLASFFRDRAYKEAFGILKTPTESTQQDAAPSPGCHRLVCLLRWTSVSRFLDKTPKRRRLILWGVRGALLTASLVMVILGIQNGGMQGVLDKAIKICTECIGLG